MIRLRLFCRSVFDTRYKNIIHADELAQWRPMLVRKGEREECDGRTAYRVAVCDLGIAFSIVDLTSMKLSFVQNTASRTSRLLRSKIVCLF